MEWFWKAKRQQTTPLCEVCKNLNWKWQHHKSIHFDIQIQAIVPIPKPTVKNPPLTLAASLSCDTSYNKTAHQRKETETYLERHHTQNLLLLCYCCTPTSLFFPLYNAQYNVIKKSIFESLGTSHRISRAWLSWSFMTPLAGWAVTLSYCSSIMATNNYYKIIYCNIVCIIL